MRKIAPHQPGCGAPGLPMIARFWRLWLTACCSPRSPPAARARPRDLCGEFRQQGTERAYRGNRARLGPGAADRAGYFRAMAQLYRLELAYIRRLVAGGSSCASDARNSLREECYSRFGNIRVTSCRLSTLVFAESIAQPSQRTSGASGTPLVAGSVLGPAGRWPAAGRFAGHRVSSDRCGGEF